MDVRELTLNDGSWLSEMNNTWSALFADTTDAYAAVRELREVGIPAGGISIISRGEHHRAADGAPLAGVSRESLGEEALTYRVSPELPNDEDLPTTIEEMTGGRTAPAPYEEVVRRNEAEANADEDIYSDFPGRPGGLNPDSPMAAHAGAQRATDRGGQIVGSGATGAGIGALAGLVAGLAALAVPGIGPVVAAGPLAAALGGIAAGAAGGGVIGALASLGVPEEYAREYAARLEQGHTLVVVTADELTRDLVERVLVANHGESVRSA